MNSVQETAYVFVLLEKNSDEPSLHQQSWQKARAVTGSSATPPLLWGEGREAYIPRLRTSPRWFHSSGILNPVLPAPVSTHPDYLSARMEVEGAVRRLFQQTSRKLPRQPGPVSQPPGGSWGKKLPIEHRMIHLSPLLRNPALKNITECPVESRGKQLIAIQAQTFDRGQSTEHYIEADLGYPGGKARIILKESDIITAFAVNKAKRNCTTITLSHDVQELDVSEILATQIYIWIDNDTEMKTKAYCYTCFYSVPLQLECC
ncbi:hypothetical protein HJG60_009903 [Phyllostomus discolor]|uniref:Uncharacterized protein n=1 Tax=Phyllostomus discolor TaxID=89673 RepID=A0A834B8K0_9CHIR|nr:hypothetical protein HJG60_009903 [Phyllostomus discolor]